MNSPLAAFAFAGVRRARVFADRSGASSAIPVPVPVIPAQAGIQGFIAAWL
ncbi:hypothetical protein [Pseudomonas sp. CGJS7]|uniref:hypothetical protein n=1 Tax=Pseudomonas sp. CGJS7 TaxID=3109348 RepID=UPI003009F9D5